MTSKSLADASFKILELREMLELKNVVADYFVDLCLCLMVLLWVFEKMILMRYLAKTVK